MSHKRKVLAGVNEKIAEIHQNTLDNETLRFYYPYRLSN